MVRTYDSWVAPPEREKTETSPLERIPSPKDHTLKCFGTEGVIFILDSEM